MKKTIPYARLIIFLAISIILVACNQEIEVMFSNDQAWNMRMEISYDPQLLETVEMAIPFLLEAMEVDKNVSPNLTGVDQYAMETSLDLIAAQYRNNGIEMRWHRASERSSETTYVVDLHGQSYTQFEQIIPEAITLKEQAPNQYHLHIILGEENQYLGIIFQQKITIRAGKILSSNAHELQGNEAIWYNPTEINLVFEPMNPFQQILPWLGGGLALLLIAIGFGRLIRKRCASCGSPIPRQAEYCPNCGAITDSESMY